MLTHQRSGRGAWDGLGSQMSGDATEQFNFALAYIDVKEASGFGK